ncbi:type I-G CRISPR-associated helicase/endonuclease Cas3g [Methylomagnum sp.]
MTDADFDACFEALTGNAPFRWQKRLFLEHFATNELPQACDLPTGLGKTSVMAIWLIAITLNPALPRRLVYVVDRRAVVDQATAEAENIKTALQSPALADLAAKLRLPENGLPVSTLRGQHADNREWLADPTTPAILVGTIDMIGSRLLFEGYGVSRGMRPYHAGLLGADSLFVLDEAHLCPPFQALLDAIAQDPRLATRAAADPLIPPFRLLPLSATGRIVDAGAFRLEPADHADPEVGKRLTAKKWLAIDEVKDATSMLAELVSRATARGGAHHRVLIYCDRREDAKKVADGLRKAGEVELLTGARRVFERESLAQRLADLGFLAGSTKCPPRPAFLVATSAGEVGVDLDADHLVCDLVAFERMVQRLGRVNRRGTGDARIEVIAAPLPKEKPADATARLARRRAPLDALPEAGEGWRDASPAAWVALKHRAAADPALARLIQDATTPPPLHPELTRAVVDAWSMTSLRHHAGRPDIQPWLRGWIDDDKPQTTVIWREHLPWRDGEDPDSGEVAAFFESAPVHLSETLEASTGEVIDTLIKRAAKIVKAAAQNKPAPDPEAANPLHPSSPALLLLDRSGQARPVRRGDSSPCGLTVGELADLAGKEKEALFSAMTGAHVVVRRDLGGLSDHGLLDEGTAHPPTTIDHGWPTQSLREVIGYRVRPGDGEPTEQHGWQSVHRFRRAPEDAENGQPPIVVEVYRGKNTPRQGDPAVSRKAQALDEHLSWTGQEADTLARALNLPDDYRTLLVAAAEAHDLGKNRTLWQDAMNAPKDEHRPYAKTTGGGNPRRLCGYRHEFGSLGDVESRRAIQDLPDDLRDLALHLIASHHGYARPVIAPVDPAAPPSVLAQRAQEAALRFARLQERWGPWGLAWWEAIFCAADQRASRKLDNDQPAKQETP